MKQPHGNTTHGHAPAGRPTPEYAAWRNMLNRCTNPGVDSYPLYGARGITVCERWQTFENFLADMGLRPAGHTLERRDSNGNYEPDNCRWATHAEQAQNTRVNKLTPELVREIRDRLARGETQTAVARSMGVSQPLISKIHLNEAWSNL